MSTGRFPRRSCFEVRNFSWVSFSKYLSKNFWSFFFLPILVMVSPRGFMEGPRGVEPRLSGPQPEVQPLHFGPVRNRIVLLLRTADPAHILTGRSLRLDIEAAKGLHEMGAVGILTPITPVIFRLKAIRNTFRTMMDHLPSLSNFGPPRRSRTFIARLSVECSAVELQADGAADGTRTRNLHHGKVAPYH